MKILTEADLRSSYANRDGDEVFVSEDTYVTPLAKEYISTHGMKLTVGRKKTDKGAFGRGLMSYSAIHASGNARYVDYVTGRAYSEKPEHMTHLRDNLLVRKDHPRILFRGKLDSLEALIMQTQLTAEKDGYPQIAEELDEVMSFVQMILACEVKDEPLHEIRLLGMDTERLRYVSHHIYEEFGIRHSVPHYSMGEVCIALNTLRTSVREAELCAVEAFTVGSHTQRTDIIEALNRLSSCVYIIFCKKAAGKYDKR